MNCKEATQISIKKHAEGAGMMDRLRLRIHLLMCKYCSFFDRQEGLIETQLEHTANTVHLTPEEKAELLAKLNQTS